MWSVTRFARLCGLSRSTILYYEEIGLMRKPGRTAGNYRAYSEQDLERLRQISVFRGAGLNLQDIRSILNQLQTDATAILRRRFTELSGEIEHLRRHQFAIAQLLKASGKFRRTTMMTKDKWTTIMRKAGFTDADMRRWHREFESAAPEEHQEFLEFLRIGKEEIRSIREWSQHPVEP
jgi:MerR family transcriptional regulator, thiopeptide resistance regulator